METLRNRWLVNLLLEFSANAEELVLPLYRHNREGKTQSIMLEATVQIHMPKYFIV